MRTSQVVQSRQVLPAKSQIISETHSLLLIFVTKATSLRLRLLGHIICSVTFRQWDVSLAAQCQLRNCPTVSCKSKQNGDQPLLANKKYGLRKKMQQQKIKGRIWMPVGEFLTPQLPEKVFKKLLYRKKKNQKKRNKKNELKVSTLKRLVYFSH